MNKYWAHFVENEAVIYRLDTRVYLVPVENPGRSDKCLGAIIGKNPGSAVPGQGSSKLSEIALQGDKCLPTIRSVVLKAYEHAGIETPLRGYVQVLNLFYICDPNLTTAVQSFRKMSEPMVCSAENKKFPWAWYAWGGNNPKINPMKERFNHVKAKAYFHYDLSKKIMVTGRPSQKTTAKHTQGLPHQPVVEYLSKVIQAQCAGSKTGDRPRFPINEEN